jgi:hypothetical protein
MNPDKLNEITGRTQSHLVPLDQDYLIHRDAHIAFNSLKEEASFAGFNLTAVSSFRSFGIIKQRENVPSSQMMVIPLSLTPFQRKKLFFESFAGALSPGPAAITGELTLMSSIKRDLIPTLDTK